MIAKSSFVLVFRDSKTRKHFVMHRACAEDLFDVAWLQVRSTILCYSCGQERKDTYLLYAFITFISS